MAKVKLSEVYDEKYEQMLIDHMAEGHSFNSFAAVIGCTHKRIEHWCNKVEGFQHAREIGEVRALLFWEKRGIEGLDKKVFNAGLWQYWMKNAFRKFGWKDKFKEDEGEDTTNTQTNIIISNDQISELIQMAKKELTPEPKQIEPVPGTVVEPEMLSNETVPDEKV